jgi:hypothetical protein
VSRYRRGLRTKLEMDGDLLKSSIAPRVVKQWSIFQACVNPYFPPKRVNLQHGSAHLLSQGFFAQANASSLRDVQMLVGNSPLSITPPYIGFIHTLGAVCSSEFDALAHAGKRF